MDETPREHTTEDERDAKRHGLIEMVTVVALALMDINGFGSRREVMIITLKTDFPNHDFQN